MGPDLALGQVWVGGSLITSLCFRPQHEGNECSNLGLLTCRKHLGFTWGWKGGGVGGREGCSLLSQLIVGVLTFNLPHSPPPGVWHHENTAFLPLKRVIYLDSITRLVPFLPDSPYSLPALD